jgi:hypothetical protein
LGNLRKEHPTLQLGDIRFTQAGQGKISFVRSYKGQSVKIYVNQSSSHWEIPKHKVLMSHWLNNGVLDPGGFCIMED